MVKRSKYPRGEQISNQYLTLFVFLLTDEPFLPLFQTNTWLYFPFNELLDHSPKWIKDAEGRREGRTHDPNVCLFSLFLYQHKLPFITEVNVNRGAQCFASGMEGDLSAILPVTDVKQQAGAGEPSGDGQRKGDCCRWASLAFLRLPF